MKVTLSPAPERTVTVLIEDAVQGGATSADYSGVPTSLTFAAADTEKTFSFAAADDSVDDDGESVKLTFGTLPTGVSEGTVKESVVSITDDDYPADVDVSFGRAAYTAAEGGSVAVKVTLSPAPERSVTIPILRANLGGATSADYSGVPPNVTFAASDTEKTFSFAATDDSVDDDGESVELTFGTLPTGLSEGTVDQSVVSITDDDYPADVDVSFGRAAYTAAEGGSVVVKVTLSPAPERSVTILIDKANQDGATSADYSGVPPSLTFAAADTEKTFSFAAAADSVDDDGESVKLTFGALPTGLSEGTVKESVVSITDDDYPADVDVSFGQAAYTAAEGGSVTVKVTLSPAPERSVTILIDKANQDGATSADYSGVPPSLTFAASDTEKTFSFAAAADSVDDDGESVKLTFGTLPTGISEGTVKESVVSITDDDVPSVTVAFEQATYTAAEGSTVTVKVKLSADPERTVTVLIEDAVQGGATSADYSGVPGSVTFSSGDTEKMFSFAATDDTEDDDGESVKLTFGALPTGVNPGTVDESVVSIADDDYPADVDVSFGQAAYTAAEGGTVTVKVTLSPAPERTVTVLIEDAVQGGATSADYSGVPTSLTFAAADTEKTFSFAATDDSVDDDGESVKLTFGTLPTGISEGTVKESVVSITDDDYPADVDVSFGRAAYTAAEGGSVAVKVTLSPAPERSVTIPILRANLGGATSADYSGVPPNVTFAASDTEKTFSFAATDDSVDDDGESVELTFGTLPTGLSEGTVDQSVVSITDDDYPADVDVSFGRAAYTAAEGGSVVVKVTLSPAPERSVTILIDKANQDGATSADYSGVPPSLTFAAADTEKTFSFAAAADSVDDDGESVKLTFGALPTGLSEGTVKESVVSITDDDYPADVDVSFGQAAYTAAEGGSVTVKVTLSPAPERSVTILIDKANQDGATSADYSGVPPSLTFAASDTEKTFSFAAAADSVDDDGESVKLTFGTLPTGISEGTVKESVVSITDDDVPSVTVAFEQATYTAAEGSTVTVKVKLSADPERTVTVLIEDAVQGGATSADYSGVPGSVTFSSGDTEKMFSFAATDDTEDDDGESVKLTFGALPTGVNPGTVDESVVSIADDDYPADVDVSFGQAAYTAAEGGTVTVKVTLSPAPERTVTVLIEDAVQDGATSADYSGVPTSLTFAAADTEKTFSFAATDDSVDDDGESVKLTFGTLPTGISEGTVKESVVSITDDDVPSVTVAFEQATYTAAEGSTVTVKVKLSADPERTVTVLIEDAVQGGATDDDYSGVPGSVTFSSGDTEKTFVFAAAADSVDDDGESVKLTFGTLPTGVAEGTVKESVVSITDDDTANITISTTSLDVGEGGSATYTVKLATEPTGDVTVTIAGIAGTDLSTDLTSLTYTSTTWNDTQTVTVSAAHDADAVDDVATVSNTATSADGDYDGIAKNVAINVEDDESEDPELSIALPDPVHNDIDDSGDVSLGDVLTYTATASNTGNVPLSDITVEDLLVNTTGVGCATLAIGATCVMTGSYTVTQSDVDDGTVDNTATADSAETTAQTATRSTGVAQTEAVSLAKSSSDSSFQVVGDEVEYEYLVSNSGTVTLTGTLQITDNKIPSGISCDDVPESGLAPAATLTCTATYTVVQSDLDVSGVTNTATASLGDATSNQSSVTVPWVGLQGTTPQLSIGAGSVSEDGSSIALLVALTPASLQTVTVSYASQDGTAKAGLDFTAPAAGSTVTFAPGSTSETITIPIIDDDIDEDNESFNVILSNAVNAAIGLSSGPVTINDDDTAGVSVSRTALAVTEGDSTGGTYTVVLDTRPTADVTVTVSGHSGTDLTLNPDPATLIFTPAAWDTAQTVTVTAGQDADGTNDTVSLTHGATSTDSGYAGIAIAGVAVTVSDDETPSTDVALSVVPEKVSEGADATTVTVTGTLNNAPRSSATSVTVVVGASDDDAAEGTDYGTVSDFTLTIGAGATSGTAAFTLTPTDDDVDEEDEALTVAGSAQGLTVTSAAVTIEDDDTAGVSVSRTALAVTEGDSTGGTYTVVLDTRPTADVVVTVAGHAGTDVTLNPTALTFTSITWDTAQTVTVTAGQDADGTNDTVSLTHGATSTDSGYAGIAIAGVAVTVSDDDTPSTDVALSVVPEKVSEGAAATTVTVTGTLNNAPRSSATSVTVVVGASDDDAAEGTDYGTVSDFTLTIGAGATSGTAAFTLNPTDDDVDEEDEALTVAGSVQGLTVTSAAVTIEDDDTAGVSVSKMSLTVAEGNSTGGTYTVVLDSRPSADVTVTVSGHAGTDLTLNPDPASLTFTPMTWDMAQTVTVTAGHDVDGTNDTVSLTHGAASTDSGYAGIAIAGVAVTVSDDETPSTDVALSVVPEKVSEGAAATTVTVTGTLNNAARSSATSVTVTVGASDDDAAEGTDYGTVSDLTLTIGAGLTTGTVAFQLTPTDDDVDEGDEALTVAGSAQGLTVTSAAVTIEDDDTAGVTVSKSSLAVAEGDGAGGTYTVVLDSRPTADVTVTVSGHAGTDLTLTRTRPA